MLGDFDENFLIIRADNNRLLKECFKLRYNIFCLEKKILPDNKHIKAESDEYDQYSIHCLLLFKPTKKYVGTVRLILGKLLNKKNFPIEDAAKQYFYDTADYHMLEREHLAEISRLAILPEFRPKFAVLGILRAVLENCVAQDVYYTYAAIEPRVQRILQRIGIQLTPISSSVSYHGERRCFLGFVQEIIESAQVSHPLIWEVLTDNGKLVCPYNSLCQAPVKGDDADEQIYNYR